MVRRHLWMKDMLHKLSLGAWQLIREDEAKKERALPIPSLELYGYLITI